MAELPGSAWTFFQLGGWGMYPICFWWVLAVAIVLERAIVLGFVSRAAPLMREVVDATLDGDVPRAIRACRARRSPLADVLRAGLEVSAHSVDRIQREMDGAWLRVQPRMRARVPYLAVLGNLSICSGLLGTMMGLIPSRSCCCACSVDPAQKVRILAEQISEATHCTAFGLAVAIFCYASFVLLESRVVALEHETRGESVRAMNLALNLSVLSSAAECGLLSEPQPDQSA